MGYNITVSKEKQFLWYRVAKVGTRTILHLLDESKVRLNKRHAMNQTFDPECYSSYFKFAFVRNPWDRVVSCWKNKVLQANYFNFSDEKLKQMQAFKHFVSFVETRNITKCDHHLRRQTALIDLNNVDFIGTHERFEPDLCSVIDRLGLQNVAIQHRNQSHDRTHYTQFYNDELIDRVGNIYQQDIEILKYTFDNL